uniref:VWFA domain-containing protein n=1 Tax=Syphacia muris TaxID=451379 RepID=A0A158R5F7_9BILA
MRVLTVLLVSIRLVSQATGDASIPELKSKAPSERVQQWSNLLGEELQLMFDETVNESLIKEMYRDTEEREFEPEEQLKKAQDALEEYLQVRSNAAWVAKKSLEGHKLQNGSESFNDRQSAKFIRYMSAKTLSNEVQLPATASGDSTTQIGILRLFQVNATEELELTPNANFYNIPTSLKASVVQIPTPVYERDMNVLAEIAWSEIDNVYRQNKERTKDLAFQMFCSSSGFMRFYPAIAWSWDNSEVKLDLYDCRSTEWYINSATMSKNVIIMLDVSGSMFGQRYEIAKQTIEAILETLSDNDFFNVMKFSKEPVFLGTCGNETRPLQATVRNKKLVLGKLTGTTSEGKAEFEKALLEAFTVVQNLNETARPATQRELLERRLHGDAPGVRYFEHGSHVLVMSDYLFEAIERYKEEGVHLGCNDVIMLITDGAPSNYEHIFAKYNSNKRVLLNYSLSISRILNSNHVQIRFFSFLIGEEATQFDQVRWMACNNNGFMVHINNLADVQEKVQYYIKVMSRPVGKYAKKIRQNEGVWSAVYQERLLTTWKNTSYQTEMFTITLGYPVAINGVLKGVAAVNVPVKELQQLANIYNPGIQSYMFMLDNNGYVIFHPQLRPINKESRKIKSNYNNIDIVELEVTESQKMVSLRFFHQHESGTPIDWRLESGDELRTAAFNCGRKKEEKILFATENLRRVYRQTNDYYIACINNGTMKLGYAVANSDTRVIDSGNINYKKVQKSWFEGKYYKIHPNWRYCLLNDSDSELTAEQAFIVYVEQMIDEGSLPKLCRQRKPLVDKLIFDSMRTQNLWNKWEKNGRNMKRPVDLTFFATSSGMIRFWDKIPDDYVTKDPKWRKKTSKPLAVNGTATVRDEKWKNTLSQRSFLTVLIQTLLASAMFFRKYLHFITELNNRSVEDEYFVRAVRLKERIVFDINKHSYLWNKSSGKTSYLVVATKALYKSKRGPLLGVAGIEFPMDYFDKLVKSIGCKSEDVESESVWCYLLDEHGYIFYSSRKFSKLSNSGDNSDYSEVGKWFGNTSALTEKAMTLLLQNGFYTNVTYTDYQAVCNREELGQIAASGYRPILTIFKSVLLLLSRIWKIVRDALTLQFMDSMFVTRVSGYTQTFRDSNDGYACDKVSHFYLANFGTPEWSGPELPKHTPSLTNADSKVRTCDSSNCDVRLYASWVKNTNLLLVVVSGKLSSSYCSNTHCKRTGAQQVPFGFNLVSQLVTFFEVQDSGDRNTNLSAEDDNRICRHIYAKERQPVTRCVYLDMNETGYPCSNSPRVSLSSLVGLVLFTTIARLSFWRIF